MEPIWINLISSLVLVALLAAALAGIRQRLPEKPGTVLDVLVLLWLLLPLGPLQIVGDCLHGSLCVLAMQWFLGSSSQEISVSLQSQLSLFKAQLSLLMVFTRFALLALPVFYLALRLAALRVKRQWVEVAEIQGLGCWGVFWNLYLPQNWLLILGGLILGILRSFFQGAVIIPDIHSFFAVAGLLINIAIAAAIIILLLRLGKRQA